MKLCKACGESKPPEDFYRHKQTKDGFRGKCKLCMHAQTAEWQRRNRGKCVAYSIAYQKRNPEVKRKHNHADYERNKEARLAKCREWRRRNARELAEYDSARRAAHPEHELARTAVRSGPLDGHHWSYDREHWLDVEWLCRSCHRNEHHANARLHADVSVGELSSMELITE